MADRCAYRASTRISFRSPAPFDKELHHFASPAGERLFYVTTGTGMVGFPMQFLMPPRVDILTIRLPE